MTLRRTRDVCAAHAGRLLTPRRSVVPVGAAALFALSAVLSVPAAAGDFDINWGTAPFDWPTNSLGPNTYTITDQYGFRLQARMTITRFGGTGQAGYPDDLVGFGSERSIWVVHDAASGSSGVGEATNTATLEILNGGSPYAVNSLYFKISDIDATDNNAANDRCDFITATGNAGNPALTYVHPVASERSVRIGPGTGSGATGALAANQAQCVYNTGSTTSPASDADDHGSILATYPAGTHTATVLYDESIENVYGVTSRDAAARGSGMWSATVITASDNSISLAKSTPTATYTASGQVITYTYTITNNGPLPINTGQNIQIQDDRIGTFTCGTISSDIPAGGTHSCTANYTVTAGDLSATEITNTAIAGVGTGTQSFASRLQSNSAQETVYNNVTDLPVAKTVNNSTPAEGDTVVFTLTATNNGPGPVTNLVLTDQLPAGLTYAGHSTANGTYSSGTGNWTVGSLGVGATATLTLSATVDALTGGSVITNTITNVAMDQTDTNTTPDDLDESVTVDNNPAITLAKTGTLVDGNSNGHADAGETIAYAFTVANTGDVTLTNISLTDPLSGLSLSGGPIASLAPGASDATTFTASYTLTQSDIDGGTVTNQATVSATDPQSGTVTDLSDDPTDATNADTEGDGEPDDPTVVALSAVPQLAIAKTANLVKAGGNTDPSAEVGDTINYTYVVENTGNITFFDVEVSDIHNGSDPLADPPHTALADNGTPGDSPDNNADATIWGTLAPGDIVTFATAYVVTQQDQDTLQ